MNAYLGRLALPLALLTFCVPSAEAQSFSGFGIKGGAALAQLRGEVEGEEDAETTDRKLGFAVGVFGTIPLGPALALQPEVLYVQKGGAFTEEDLEVEADLNLDYVQVPVLVKLTLPAGGAIVPSLYAGPYASYAVSREFEFDADVVGGVIDAEDVIERLDYGVALGADVGFNLGGSGATLGLRYDLGLANVAEGPLDGGAGDLELTTRTFVLMLGLAL